MQLIFLSTMEQKVGEDRARSAQVSITEHQGAWRVLWSEEDADGKPAQDCWYEGDAWRDLLYHFREGLKMKRGDGFFPLIDPSIPGGMESVRNRDVLILQYYGEMHYSDAVFQELRAWRRRTAAKEGKSAYFVATNRMLYMLGAYLPRTVEELKQIPGFGARKAELYGPEVLAVTAKVERTIAFPLDWVKAEVPESDFEGWLVEQMRSRQQQEQAKDLHRKQVLEGAAAGAKLAALEDATGLKRPDLVRLVEELDRGGYDMEPLVHAELAGVAEAESARIQAAFAKLGTRFLKPVLQALYTEEQQKDLDLTDLYEKLRLQRIRYRAAFPASEVGGARGERSVGRAAGVAADSAVDDAAAGIAAGTASSGTVDATVSAAATAAPPAV